MSKPRGAPKGALFSDLEMNGCAVSDVQSKAATTARNVSQSSRTRKKKSQLVDGIVGGERVLIATDPAPREKGIEVQIRVALSSAGIMCMKHHVDHRALFGRGLGLGVADLICVVPPYGRFLGIECKRPGYSPSDVRDEQRKWLAMVRRYGGVSGIATSVDEAMALVNEARRMPEPGLVYR
jgi:hypothetical protein